VTDILNAVQTLPFLSDRRLVIVKDTHKYRAPDLQKLAEFLKNPVLTSCIVLLWPERIGREEKSKSIFTTAEKSGTVVEFRLPYENELPQWVIEKMKEKGKAIEREAVQYLVQESGSNLLDLSNEIEKLALFAGGKTTVTLADVEQMSGHTRLANLNGLSEAVEQRDVLGALRITEALLSEGEVPLRILATVQRALRRMLVAKSLLEEKKKSCQEIWQELRLRKYFDRNFFTYLSRYTQKELELAMEKLVTADASLKSSSRPEQMLFEELLLSLARDRANQPR
jgi:DNA polymerase-3 subunit delta